jgi:hypothetical protein
MLEATRRKLGEARFFYQHLINENPMARRHDPAAFRYYFSAFIQAARNVTWVLHNEEKERWEAWEPKWRAKRSAEEQKLLDLTNKLRIDEVKRGGTKQTVELEESGVVKSEREAYESTGFLADHHLCPVGHSLDFDRLTATPEYNRYMARDIFSTCEERAKEAA